MAYFCFYLLWFVMNLATVRDWKILCWNVRGLNSEARQLVVKQKIEESGCSIVCLQETKCMHIDQRFLRKFVLDALIILCICHRLVLLVVSWLFGIRLSSLAN